MSEDKTDEPRQETRWVNLKYRLSMFAVILSLIFMFYMLFEGSVMNMKCPFLDFLSMECNRYDPESRAVD